MRVIGSDIFIFCGSDPLLITIGGMILAYLSVMDVCASVAGLAP